MTNTEGLNPQSSSDSVTKTDLGVAVGVLLAAVVVLAVIIVVLAVVFIRKTHHCRVNVNG